jgi:single-stranded DNA-binding protein
MFEKIGELMQGENFVRLVGFLKYPQLKQTATGKTYFQGKVAVPFSYTDRQSNEIKEGVKYVKVSAWGEAATALGGLPDDTAVQVSGIFNERSYDGNCKHCGAQDKKYWTDVLVDSVMVAGG